MSSLLQFPFHLQLKLLAMVIVNEPTASWATWRDKSLYGRSGTSQVVVSTNFKSQQNWTKFMPYYDSDWKYSIYKSPVLRIVFVLC